jgi:hypothetical protein
MLGIGKGRILVVEFALSGGAGLKRLCSGELLRTWIVDTEKRIKRWETFDDLRGDHPTPPGSLSSGGHQEQRSFNL